MFKSLCILPFKKTHVFTTLLQRIVHYLNDDYRIFFSWFESTKRLERKHCGLTNSIYIYFEKVIILQAYTDCTSSVVKYSAYSHNTLCLLIYYLYDTFVIMEKVSGIMK